MKRHIRQANRHALYLYLYLQSKALIRVIYVPNTKCKKYVFHPFFFFFFFKCCTREIHEELFIHHSRFTILIRHGHMTQKILIRNFSLLLIQKQQRI